MRTPNVRRTNAVLLRRPELMGHKKDKYLRKLHQQKVNSQENKVYYQNGSNWSTPSSEAEIRRRRTLEKP